MKSMYEMYGTVDNYEINGIWQDLGSFRVKIARAGNKNSLYLKTFKNVMKRWGKKNYENVDDEESKLIMAEIFSKAVVKGWQIKNENGGWEDGLTLMVDGVETKVEYNSENVAKVLVDLPDLFSALQEWAGERKTFQKEIEEEQLQD
jgi:hypothetical protein